MKIYNYYKTEIKYCTQESSISKNGTGLEKEYNKNGDLSSISNFKKYNPSGLYIFYTNNYSNIRQKDFCIISQLIN